MTSRFATFLVSLLLIHSATTTAVAEDPRPPFSVRIAGNEHLRILDMAADPSSGDIIVVGATASKPLPGSSLGGYQSPKTDKDNGFVMRLSADGSTLRFTSIVGGLEDDEITGVAIAPSGAILLAGNTQSGGGSFPLTSNPLDKSADKGDREAFFAVLSPDGKTLYYSTFLGGEKFDSAADIIVLDNERTVIVGETESGNQFPGAPALPSSNSADAFIAVIAVPGGNHTLAHTIKSVLLTGKGRDYCTAASPLPNGRFAVTGGTTSADFPVNIPAPVCQFKGKTDAFAAVCDASSLTSANVWCFGGTSNDEGLSVATLNNNIIGICGKTTSSDLPAGDKKLFSAFSGASDGFVAMFTISGVLQFSSYLGGKGNEAAASIAFTERDGLVVAGTTSSPDFPVVGADALTDKFSGDNDCFVSVISPIRAKLLFSTMFGGAKSDSLSKIILSPDDGFIACGSTTSENDFRPKFINNPPADDHSDGFITRCTIRPNVIAEPSSLQFPNTFIGISKVDSVILAATGFGVAEFVPAIIDDPQGNFRLVSTQKVILPSAERIAVSVVFEPKTSGNKKATLIFMANNGKDTLRSRVLLNGNGIAPVILTNSPLIFDDTEVDSTSPTLKLIIKNLRSEICKIETVFCEGNDAAFFAVSPDVTFPVAIDPNQTGVLGVVFRPAARRKYSCTVVIKTNRGNLEGILSGTGVGAVVIANEQSLDFESVGIGDSASKTVEIRNTGEKEAAYTLSIENNANYTVTEPMTGTLPAGGMRTVELTFAPKATGLSKATLLVAGAKFPAKRVPLTGIGVAPPKISLALRIDSLRASIGNTVKLPIRILSADGFPKSGARTYKATLRYNGTVLGIDKSNLTNYNPQTSVHPWRTITLSGNYTLPIAVDSVLCSAELIAALGDTNFTAIELTSLQWLDDKGNELRSEFSVINGSVAIGDADNGKLPTGTVISLATYPTPATGTLNFKISSPIDNPVLTLYSVAGAAVAQFKLTVTPDVAQIFSVSTRQFGNGAYYAVLAAGSFTVVSPCFIYAP